MRRRRVNKPSASWSRTADIEAQVVGALAASQLPEDVRADLDPRLADAKPEEVSIPPLLQRGLAQSGITMPNLLVKALILEMKIEYLERDLERIESHLLTEGRAILIVLTIIGIVLGIAAGLVKILG